MFPEPTVETTVEVLEPKRNNYIGKTHCIVKTATLFLLHLLTPWLRFRKILVISQRQPRKSHTFHFFICYKLTTENYCTTTLYCLSVCLCVCAWAQSWFSFSVLFRCCHGYCCSPTCHCCLNALSQRRLTHMHTPE